MARLGGADEVVVGDVEQRPGLPEPLAGLVGLLERGEAVGLRRPLNLQPMFVGAGEEERLVAEQPMPASQRVGGERRVGVADVRARR